MLRTRALLAAALALMAGCAVDSEIADSHGHALGSDADDSDAHGGEPEEPPPSHPPRLRRGSFGFTTLDVGQGDAAVVVAPDGCVALFDAGPTGSGQTIKDYLHALDVTRIDFAIVSHYHEDHLGGLDEVERGNDAIPIATIYDHGGSYSSGAYAQYDAQFRGRRRAVATGFHVSLCEQVAVDVVSSNANGLPTRDENERSVVAKISYGALDLLVGGDLGFRGPDMESVVASAVGPVEVYKVHHHGSNGSSSAEFLDRTKPTVSLISVGYKNSYGHPTPSTLSRLHAAGSAVWQTAGATDAQRGHVEVASADGLTFTVTKNETTSMYATKPATIATDAPR